jgi:hypothetical protein
VVAALAAGAAGHRGGKLSRNGPHENSPVYNAVCLGVQNRNPGFIVSLAVLLLAVKFSGVSADEKKKWLSPPQTRFEFRCPTKPLAEFGVRVRGVHYGQYTSQAKLGY